MGVDIDKLVKEAVNAIKSQNDSLLLQNEKHKIGYISLEIAKELAAKVEQKAREIGINVVVAIADEGGNLKLCECMDNSYIASRDIAINKAYTAVALKMSTKKLSKLAQPGGSLYGIQHTNNGRIVIFGGGDVLSSFGKILGGIGISGGSEEQDSALCEYGTKIFDEIFT